MYDSDGDLEVVLYERAQLPPPAAEQVEAVYERLRSLSEANRVDSVTREEWTKRIPVDDCGGELRDTYLSFQSWADRNGASLRPFFQTRKCFSPTEGDWADWLVLPAFCLAVTEDDSVSAVYPHSDDTGTQSVEDGLTTLVTDLGEDAAAPTAAD